MPDQDFICRDCGAGFLFTEAEQEFFRAQGFGHPPKRCKTCRARQRQRDGREPHAPRADHGAVPPAQAAGATRGMPAEAIPHEGGPLAEAPHDVAALAMGQAPAPPAAGSGGAPTAEPPARPPRPRGPMHATTCSVCGLPTEVPFVPDGVRPVYCLPCLKKQTR